MAYTENCEERAKTSYGPSASASSVPDCPRATATTMGPSDEGTLTGVPAPGAVVRAGSIPAPAPTMTIAARVTAEIPTPRVIEPALRRGRDIAFIGFPYWLGERGRSEASRSRRSV